ncbi:ABC transporter permease subunit [Virgibacillus sp. DJP39]|uniref:ABC transporter permease subunit n=1 Tax=Virgibacillus sp. DJP39 TaxID=3409790 RepID=UPI003BB6B265
MNIFLHEMKVNRKSNLIWTGALVVLVVFFMSMFPSISKEIEVFKKLLEGFPEEVRSALGIQVDSIGSVIGYYSYTFLYLTLCGAIQAMNLGISIGSRETVEKTADFLLTKPVTRFKILLSKLVAAISSLLFTTTILIVTATIMLQLVKTEAYNNQVFLMISITFLFVQLIFLGLGMFISVIYSKIKSVITVSLSIVFLFFIIGMVAGIDGQDLGRYFSPFQYFDTTYIMIHSSYEPAFLLVGMTIIIVSIILSFMIYTKKDIHTV